MRGKVRLRRTLFTSVIKRNPRLPLPEAADARNSPSVTPASLSGQPTQPGVAASFFSCQFLHYLIP